MIVELELKDLVIPQGFLPRVLTGTVEEKVEEYREMIEEGVEFDPVLVWKRKDGTYWVIDGAHRLEAYRRAGRERIKAKLVECRDELDYRIKAIQANLKHGLPIARGERRILAQILYKEGVSEEEIRRIFGVSERTIKLWLSPVKEEEKQEKIRKALELREKGYTQEQIAKELGVDRSTISKWLKECEKMQVLQNFTSLLHPDTGEPTPESTHLFEEYLSTMDRLPSAWNWSNFQRWLENQGKEVEGSVEEFVRAFTSVMKEAFRHFARMGEEDYEAVKRYLSGKEPLSKLTAANRKKLLDWGERFYRKMLEEASHGFTSQPQLPPSPDLAGPQPALSNEEESVEDYIKNITPEQIREVQELLEQLEQDEEKKRKPGPGRPKKEPLPLDKRQLEYWRDKILEILYDVARGWGWEEAERILREVEEEFYETKASAVR